MNQIKPIKNSIKATMHEPEYTVHRYFARRPHNVINNLIQHYIADKNALVFDPFGGGGTMLCEALICENRAIASDTSDLACFIIEQEALMASVDLDILSDFVHRLMGSLESQFSSLYTFNQKEVYWLEWSSYTSCPDCKKKVFLSPFNTVGGGKYICEYCKKQFKPTGVSADNISPVEICCMNPGSIKCGKPQEQIRYSPDPKDLETFYEKLCKGLCNIGLEDALIPKTKIPDCNLQKESALHKKGIYYFEQFIPKASRGIITYIGNYIMSSELSDDNKRHLIFVLSASLRYCSRFSSLNQAWRGNKPMEWAKSNFWTPYTFIEVNPIITFYERWQSYITAVKNAKRRFKSVPVQGDCKQVLEKRASFSVVNTSSEKMDSMPDACVDLIVTDPPYGSYLHYGELSAFWTTWLSKFLTNIHSVPDRTFEAVPARKKGYPGWKTFFDYEKILERVFSECYRVLKNNSYCVVTFNNKEPEAWIAFLRSVKKAGFILPVKGIIFQDGVESYKKSIDSRRGGAIFGDFIYSFYKDADHMPVTDQVASNWKDNLDRSLKKLMRTSKQISNVDLYTNVYLKLLPELYNAIDTCSEDTNFIADLTFKNFEQKINEYYEYSDGIWYKK